MHYNFVEGDQRTNEGLLLKSHVHPLFIRWAKFPTPCWPRFFTHGPLWFIAGLFKQVPIA
jgi:hypothetical protein